jgi:hypothetical protein
MSFEHNNFPISEAEAEAQRVAKRDSLFLGAQVCVKSETKAFDVRVRNLSTGGLLAEAKRCPAPGTEIMIELRNIGEIPARIIWSGAGQFGVAFDIPVNPQDVRTPVGKGPRANDPVLRPMYPNPGRSTVKR